MAGASSNNNRPPQKPRVIVITGPPLSGRDDYLRSVVDILRGRGLNIGYHYAFEEMQNVAINYGITNLTRANVLSVQSETLDRIRTEAFTNISKQIKGSTNDIEFISTPSSFRIHPSQAAPSGKMNGLELPHLKLLHPDLVVILIADLLDVKKALDADAVWSSQISGDFKTLAEWRRESIDLMEFDASNWSLAEDKRPLDHIIFGRAHSPDTLADLCIGKKPRIYTSFAITEAPPGSVAKVDEVRRKLEEHFVAINPYTIKDWELIAKYDDAVEKGKGEIEVKLDGQITKIPTTELGAAIDEIRTQTVTRDHSLVRNCHATVVVHLTKNPSYGVMSEVIETRKGYNRVYVIYPFKTRPSPFFEYYASTDNIFRTEELERCVDSLIARMKKDIEAGLWLRLKPSS